MNFKQNGFLTGLLFYCRENFFNGDSHAKFSIYNFRRIHGNRFPKPDMGFSSLIAGINHKFYFKRLFDSWVWENLKLSLSRIIQLVILKIREIKFMT